MIIFIKIKTGFTRHGIKTKGIDGTIGSWSITPKILGACFKKRVSGSRESQQE